MKRALLLLLTIYSLLFANAQPGTPDKTYGNNGRVETDLGIQDKATGMAIQKDGKNIVVGYAGVLTKLGQFIVQASNFAVARYNTDGSLDNSFGNGGKVLTKFDYNSSDVAVDVLLQPDGKIVVGGYGENFKKLGTTDPSAAEIVRYNRNGSIDSTFGTGGKVRYQANSAIFIASIASQSDGSILLGGTKDDRFTVLRFTKSGRFDTSFGTNGIAVADFGSYCSIYSIAVDGSDKIVMTGLSQTGRFLVSRFGKNGNLDNTFGKNGFVQTDFSSNNIPKSAYATSVLIQPDGKIVVGGNVSWGIAVNLILYRYGIARYNTDGSLDKSFGDGGKQLIRVSNPGKVCLSYKILLKPDGKIMQIGESGINIGIAQLLSNGQLDNSYGVNGISASFSFDGQFISPALTGVLQKNGKLITGGYVTAPPYDTSRLDWSIVRFNGDNNAIEQSFTSAAAMQKELSFDLLSVYPNPVPNNVTTLTYTLAKAEKITISLTNMQGRVLKIFMYEKNQPAGRYSQQLALPPGMLTGTYTITISAAGEKRMLTIVK